MQKYLIDSNAFIFSYRQCYQFHIFPSFWKWLIKEIKSNGRQILLPRSVYKELVLKSKYKDPLSNWIKPLSSYVLEDRTDNKVMVNYGKVIQYVDDEMIYKQGPDNDWNKEGKADPMLIALAMTYGYTIVTNEQRSGQFKKVRDLTGQPTNALKNPNRPASKEPKIPDVADHYGLRCIDLFKLENELNLRI